MTTDQLKSQATGLLLASATAVGCLAYERLVKNFSYATVVLCVTFSYFPFFLLALVLDNGLKADLVRLKEHKMAVLVFLFSGVTSWCWYAITRKQGVVVGALYEVKYIVVLALIYILFGTSKFTLNTLAGIVLASLSVYFISRK